MNVEVTQSQPKLNILEIGEASHMVAAFPGTTEFYSTLYDRTKSDPARRRYPAALRYLPQLARRLTDSSLDLIVVQPAPHPPWSARAFSRSVFRRSTLRGNFGYWYTFGQQLLRAPTTAPIAVIDLDDPPVIFHHNLYLLKRATIYFKRELPTDRWRLFMGTAHPRVPTPRLRSIPRYQEWLDKVRPISLGVPAKTFDSYLQHSQSFPAQKSTDIFFSGRISDSSSVRRRGLDELLALRSEGVIVDIPDRVLPRGEFLQRCAHARMVWCPEGFGWDCFRMYEAALCGSVPLVSRQTIERHEPLVDGIHALYYDIESGGLRNQIQRALKDFPGLVRIAAAARAHVMSHHTPMAIARYVADTTLASLSLKRQSTE